MAHATRLRGKIAFVTGAARGIGLAVTEAFLAEGARVIAADNNEQALSRLIDTPALDICHLDVTDELAIGAASRKYPDVELLVNCAGYVAQGSILQASRADVDHSYLMNVVSVFLMTQAFVPKMVERGRGSIVNIASVVSTVKAAADRCAYAASKGAVIALTKSIAFDLVRYGVRCNAISPGTVESPSLEERIAAAPDPEDARQRLISRQPVGRLGRPYEIAAVAALLASDDAGFMTGSNIVIDGGFSL
jgi:2-keto-3-deoxy-L-fuconate dehydrogenase